MLPCRTDPVVRAMLAVAPPMDIVDPTAWTQFKIHSSPRVVGYVETTARLMQLEMSNGIRLSIIAKGALMMATPPEGLKYDECAVAMRALRSRKYWAHNSEFRNWWKAMRRRKVYR